MTYNSYLPEHSLYAVKILYCVAQGQSDLVGLFTAHQVLKYSIIQRGMSHAYLNVTQKLNTVGGCNGSLMSIFFLQGQAGELLNGFVECLEVEEPEELDPDTQQGIL